MTQLTHYHIEYRSYRVSYLPDYLLTWFASDGKRILFTAVLDVTIPPEKINKNNNSGADEASSLAERLTHPQRTDTWEAKRDGQMPFSELKSGQQEVKLNNDINPF